MWLRRPRLRPLCNIFPPRQLSWTRNISPLPPPRRLLATTPMPICRSAACALARSRTTFNASPSKSLAPFLYQTPTIQQRRPISARTALSSPSRNHDDIPFERVQNPAEDHDSPSTHETAETPARKTTVTGGERQAFEKLYQKFSQDRKLQDEDDQVFDEYYEGDDDMDDDPASVEALFDSVLERGQQWGKKRPENLKTMAEAVLNPKVEKARQMKRAAAILAREKRIKSARRDRVRVDHLLFAAQSDREIWDIITQEVFDKIRALDLDGQLTSPKRSRDLDGTDLNSDTLFANVSAHLLMAARLLRNNYPRSPLPFQILPTLKSLGRSAYALGASTPLYNTLLRIAWTQHSSYTYIENLLTDMENGGIQFDVSTLQLLDGVCQEYNTLIKMRMKSASPAARLIFKMDLYSEGAKRVQGWRDLVKERVEKDARSVNRRRSLWST